MTQWEYHVESAPDSKALASLGLNGWELIHVFHEYLGYRDFMVLYYFKRPKQSEKLESQINIGGCF